MGNSPVIAAILESNEGLQLLDHEILSPGEASSLGYTREDIGQRENYADYRERREMFSPEADSLDYHSIVKEIIDSYALLYRENLLEDDVMEKARGDIIFLDRNRDRRLNQSETEAVISSAMKNEDYFPRKAVDKEELVDRLYIGLYDSLTDVPHSKISESEGNVV